MSDIRVLNRALIIIALLASLLALGGCDLLNSLLGTGQGEASLTLGQSAVTVSVGKTKTVSVVALAAGGSAETFTATVDDTSIAQVSAAMNSVTVTGVYQGNALVTVVSRSGQMATISVTVTPAGSGGSSTTPDADSSLASLSCNGVSIALSPGLFTYSVTVQASVTSATIVAAAAQASLAHVQVNQTPGGTAAMALSEGLNTAIVFVTSHDASSTSIYQVMITKLAQAQQDATLSALSFSGITFAGFAAGTTQYSITAPQGATSTVASATPNAAAATVAFNGVAGTPAAGVYASPAIALAAGTTTTVFITVNSSDQSASITYKVDIATPAASSNDATLKRLTGSDLVFTFDPSLRQYDLSVPNTVSSTTIYATPNQANATVAVLGPSGAATSQALAVGSNTLTVRVTATDAATTMTYTLNITRAAPASNDASLGSLGATGLTIGFSPGVFSYDLSVPYTLSSTTLNAIASQATATVSVSGADLVAGTTSTYTLAVGLNSIALLVTAPDGATKQVYTLNVTRAAPPSGDASLSALSASGIASFQFLPGTGNYSLSAPYTLENTELTAVAAQANATLSVNVNGLALTAKPYLCSLATGSNTITILVTAPDGTTTKTYTLYIAKAAPPSTDASLATLSASGVTGLAFSPGTLSYPNLSVQNATLSTTVTAGPNSASATVSFNGTAGAPSSGLYISEAIPLAEGATTTVSVVVTAADALTKNTYTLYIWRPAAIVAPTVVSTSPANGATGVSVSGAVTATFSAGMRADTINPASFILVGATAAQGDVTYDSATKTATFKPYVSAPLAYGSTYTATIGTAVLDAAGTPMASPKVWTFTTEAAPAARMAVLWSDPSYPTFVEDIKAKILAAADGRFTAVDGIDISASTGSVPTLASLSGYNAVLVHTNAPVKDRVALGDCLAGFVDQGKGVVLAAYSFFDPALYPQYGWDAYSLGGRFQSGGYYPVTMATYYNGNNAPSMAPDDPSHPILLGVGNFSGGWWNTGMSPLPNAHLVAHYSGTSDPLLVTMGGPAGKGRIVAFNARPVSDSVGYGNGWDPATDGGRIMANSLCWAASMAQTHYLGNYDFRLAGWSDWSGTYSTSAQWTAYANIASGGDYLPCWLFGLDPGYLSNGPIDFQVRTAESGALDTCVYRADTGTAASGYGVGMSQTMAQAVTILDGTLKLKLRFKINSFTGGNWGTTYYEAPVIVSLKVNGAWYTLKAYTISPKTAAGPNGEIVTASTWIERDISLLGLNLSAGSNGTACALGAATAIQGVDLSSVGYTHQILIDTVDLHR